MANQLLTINSEVPSRDLPGTPAVVFYDNGDWEIAFDGDVSYIDETSPNYLGSVKVIDIIDELRLLEDDDVCDVDDDRTVLFLSTYTNVGSAGEYVVGVLADGSSTIMFRVQAERMVEKEAAMHNFVPVVDLLEELRSFVSYHGDEMFDEADSFGIDDEDGLDD